LDLGFIGLGKLGLECAEVFAQYHSVRGYDIYPRSSDTVEICGIEQVIKQSQWIFVAVPTPHATGYDGSLPSSHLPPCDFDYSAVEQCFHEINRWAQEPKTIVLISTVLPGTLRKLVSGSLDSTHCLIYNPYLIAMGSVKWDMVNPEMIMIGGAVGTEPEIQQLVEIYQPMMQNHPRFVTGTWEECEAIKIFYNTFISAKIGLVNMIQDFSMKVGNINVDVVTDALAASTMRIMGPKYMKAGMGDAGACHPRDNIALRWLAQEHNLGYDIFAAIMQGREAQAENLARFLVDQSEKSGLPVVIHGKAYKPDVPYCIGSYSTLIGHYVSQMGSPVSYVDPIADDPTDVIDQISQACVLLLAHNRQITYGYTGLDHREGFYCDIPEHSIIVDPWRTLEPSEKYKVMHYGNTRN